MLAATPDAFNSKVTWLGKGFQTADNSTIISVGKALQLAVDSIFLHRKGIIILADSTTFFFEKEGRLQINSC